MRAALERVSTEGVSELSSGYQKKKKKAFMEKLFQAKEKVNKKALDIKH